MTFLSRVLTALLVLLSVPALAQQRDYVIEAHPAMWTVRTPTATAYLLGSIHLLPPKVHWQTPEIVAAMNAADTFVFEVPIDDTATKQIADYIDKNGTLPKGVTLASLLTPQQSKDLNAAIAATGIDPKIVENKRPWLASLVFDVAGAQKENYSLDSGVDHQIHEFATAHHRQVKGFETVADQLALFAPKDRTLEIKEFDINLKQIVSDADELEDLVSAWEAGNAKQVSDIMNKDLASDPVTAKGLLEDRNIKWVAELKTMLQQHHTYFISVGAGHLVGPKSVPAMLRAAGYKVDGL